MEFVRHTVFSFAQESTRYCNYSKDKFGNELTFIIPCWIPEELQGEYRWGWNTELTKEQVIKYCKFFTTEKQWFAFQTLITSLTIAENNYFDLLENGWQPQQARSILPNALKTELVMTGFDSDWEHFFELRTPTTAHPQARELATPLQKEMNKIK